MVATDGHRLAHIEKLGETLEGISGREEDADPAQGAGRARSRCLRNTDAETLEFADDEQTLFFRVGGRVLTSRKLTGQFPNYEAVLPRDNNKFVIVRWEDLMGSIQRVAQFADERSGAIKIRLEQNELKLSSLVHRRRRVGRHDRDAVQLRSAGGGLQLQLPDRLPEGDRQHRRGAPGVQGRAVRRPDAARGSG